MSVLLESLLPVAPDSQPYVAEWPRGRIEAVLAVGDATALASCTAAIVSLRLLRDLDLPLVGVDQVISDHRMLSVSEWSGV